MEEWNFKKPFCLLWYTHPGDSTNSIHYRIQLLQSVSSVIGALEIEKRCNFYSHRFIRIKLVHQSYWQKLHRYTACPAWLELNKKQEWYHQAETDNQRTMPKAPCTHQTYNGGGGWIQEVLDNRCIINIKNLRMTLPKGGGRPSLDPPLTAKLTNANVIVTGFGESCNLVRESKMFVKDEAEVSSRVGGVKWRVVYFGKLVFSKRERYVTFAICHRPSVCLWSVVCLWRWCTLLRRLNFSAFFFTIR